MTCTLLCKLSSSVAGRSKQNSNVVLMVCSFIFGRLQDKARPHVAEGKLRLYLRIRVQLFERSDGLVSRAGHGAKLPLQISQRKWSPDLSSRIFKWLRTLHVFWVGDRCLGTKAFCTPAIKAQLWRRTLKPINYTVRFYASFPCSFIFI